MAGDRPKLFISHGSVDKDVCERIATALVDRFDVKLDSLFLVAGEPWRDEIKSWLRTCAAALIVLSEKASESPWVQYEVALLAERHEVRPDEIVIVPILLDAAPAEILKDGGLAPARLDALQALKTTSAAPDLVAIRTRLEPAAVWFAETEAWKRVELPIAAQIELKGDAALAIVEDALGIEPGDRLLAANRARWLARELLKAPFEDQCEVARRLAPVFDEQPAVKLLTSVMPFGWVDGAAADRLREEATRRLEPRARHAIGLRSTRKDTPLHYVRRACRAIPSWRPIVPSLPIDHTGSLVEEIVAEVTTYLRLTGEAKKCRLEREIERWIRRNGPLIVLLPEPVAALDVVLLDELTNALPQLTFVLRSDDPDADLETRFPRVVALPRLDPAREAEIFQLYDDTVQDIRDATGY